MYRIGFAILCLFALTISAQATHHDGYVNNDGYTYKGGYWYWGAAAYTHSTNYTPGYWNCGRYYPGSSYSLYTRAYPPAEPVAQKDQIEQLLDAKLKELKAADKVNNFANAAKTLGYDLRTPVAPPGFAAPYAGPYSYGGHYYQNYYAAGGNTLYAPTPLVYGSLDLNQLNLNAAQLVQSGMDASKAALLGHQSLVDNQNNGAARIAEIEARGRVTQAMLQATFGDKHLRSQGFEFKITPEGQFIPKLAGMAQDKRSALQKSGEAVLTAKCASCHSDGKRPFQVSNWPNMSDVQVDALIADRLLTKDAAKLMPRKAEGGAGTPLGIDEVLALKSINAK